jgi:hypothetical protein
MTEKTEMNWNDEIDPSADRPERVLMPEGPVKFAVLSFKRARKEFGKFGTINVAEIKLLVISVSGEGDGAEVTINLGLHADLQWKITEFFTAIGQRAHGDKGKFVPNWAKVEDSEGYAINKHRELVTKKGEKYMVNDLAKFCTKEEAEADVVKETPNF